MKKPARRYHMVFLILVVFSFCAILPPTASAQPAIQVLIDGRQLQMDVPPVIQQGRTLVPLRAIFEALGATVQWNAEERSIAAAKGDLTLKLVIGSTTATKNGIQVPLDVPPTIIDGRTMVPARFVSESLGATVEWDGASNSVKVTTRNEYFLNIPGENWALAFNQEGFKIEQREAYPDLSGIRIFASNHDNGFVLSIYLEKVKNAGDSKACRDYYMAEGLAGIAIISGKGQVTQREIGDMALVEYLFEGMSGLTLNQQNVHAFMSYASTYIDIHLSKVLYKPEDQKLFDGFLSQVRIVENYNVSAKEYFAVGSSYYLRSNYEKAIPYYQKALDLEKANRTLELNFWRVLVDNLGMAYGMTGKLDKSKEVYNYAIPLDPTYPNFYYSLACFYAESNDMQGALKNLELAYKYRENIIPGETFPDPRVDTSFAGYMQNKEFTDALTKIGYR